MKLYLIVWFIVIQLCGGTWLTMWLFNLGTIQQRDGLVSMFGAALVSGLFGLYLMKEILTLKNKEV